MDLGKVRWYVEEQMKDLPRLVNEKIDGGLHLGHAILNGIKFITSSRTILTIDIFEKTTLRWILPELSQYRFGRNADTGRN